MQILSLLKRIIPFVVALVLGIGAAGIFVKKDVPTLNLDGAGEGKCLSAGHPLPCLDGPVAPAKAPAPGDSVKTPCTGTCNVKILSKRRASYTDAARQNNVQGNVTLRITFLASGEIGGITPISGLPDGLTEQAIAAARQIKFTPATKNGTPYTKQMTMQYSFTIY